MRRYDLPRVGVDTDVSFRSVQVSEDGPADAAYGKLKLAEVKKTDAT